MFKEHGEKAVVALRAKGEASALAFGEQAVGTKKYLETKQENSQRKICQTMISNELNRRGFLTPRAHNGHKHRMHACGSDTRN